MDLKYEETIRSSMRADPDVVMIGEIDSSHDRKERISMKYSIEDPPKYRINALPSTAPVEAFDIGLLPAKLATAQGYRESVIVFARSATPDLLVTNLVVNAVPAGVASLCTSSAELALLAATVHFGHSLAFILEEGRGKERLASWSAKFASKFMAPLIQREVTVILEPVDVALWLNPVSGEGCWWTRSAGSPPGTEWA